MTDHAVASDGPFLCSDQGGASGAIIKSDRHSAESLAVAVLVTMAKISVESSAVLVTMAKIACACPHLYDDLQRLRASLGACVKR